MYKATGVTYDNKWGDLCTLALHRGHHSGGLFLVGALTFPNT